MRSTFTPGPSSISYCVTVGPAREPGDPRVDLELVEHARDRRDDVVVRRRARLARRARGEGRRGGQVVGAFGLGCRDARGAVGAGRGIRLAVAALVEHGEHVRRAAVVAAELGAAARHVAGEPLQGGFGALEVAEHPGAVRARAADALDGRLEAARRGARAEHLGDAVDARGLERRVLLAVRSLRRHHGIRPVRSVSSPSESMPSSSVCAVLRSLRREGFSAASRSSGSGRRTARRRARGSGRRCGSAASW